MPGPPEQQLAGAPVNSEDPYSPVAAPAGTVRMVATAHARPATPSTLKGQLQAWSAEAGHILATRAWALPLVSVACLLVCLLAHLPVPTK